MDKNTQFGGSCNMSRCQQMDLTDAMKEVKAGHRYREYRQQLLQDAHRIKDSFKHLNDVSVSKIIWAVGKFGFTKVWKAAESNLSKFTFNQAIDTLLKKVKIPVLDKK